MSDTEISSPEMSDHKPNANEELEEERETVWDKIMWETYVENKENLATLDKTKLKEKFKKYFLVKVKEWLPMLQDFMENDRIKAAIWGTKETVASDSSDEEEDILVAVDQRKYKIWKIIDWNIVENWFTEEEEEYTNENQDSGVDILSS